MKISEVKTAFKIADVEKDEVDCLRIRNRPINKIP